MAPTDLRLAPLQDRDEDASLFVAPEAYETALWAAREGLNLLVVGERGAGKTSLLHQLQLSLRKGGHSHMVVFLDLAGAGALDTALNQLVAAATESLGREHSWVPALPRPSESEQEARTRNALDQLSSLEPCAFVIDNTQAERVGFPLFGIFRDRLWEAPHQWIMSATALERRSLLRPPADAFWEQTVELTYSPAAAAEILERRLAARPDWLAELVGEVGVNPRRLIQAALDISREGEGEGGGTRLRAWKQWQERLTLLPRRQAVLVAELAARGPVSASDPDLLASLGWARTSLIEALEQLEREQLVESWSEPTGRGRPRRLFATRQPGQPRRA